MEVINNFEIKIWEQLLNKINIVKNYQGKYVVEIDNYKGVIRETLLNTIVYHYYYRSYTLALKKM